MKKLYISPVVDDVLMLPVAAVLSTSPQGEDSDPWGNPPSPTAPARNKVF